MGRVSHVVSIADDMSHNPYFHGFISGNEKQPVRSILTRSAFSSCHTLISVSKIRLCLSAVNGTAQIHQSFEKELSSLCKKNAPASCFGNRGGSFALWVFIRAFQALTPSLAGIFDGSLSGCQNYRAFLASFVLCDYPQSHSLFSNPPWIRGPTKNVTKALGSCS